MKILTFDIEEWFHCDFISDSSTWKNYETRIYEANDKILQALENKKIKATFFILGWIAEKYPEVVKKIHASGHEIACHSYIHELVHRMNPDSFRRDTEVAMKLIEDIIGEKIITYRAPAFSITEKTPWAFEILSELGIEYDCSVLPSSSHDYGGFPSFGECLPSVIKVNGCYIKEFPMNTVHLLGKEIIFSGGGFFRLFPYFLIRKWAEETKYVVSYFHPRDFDYEQPMLSQLPLKRKFKSYVGLKSSYPKLLKWLNDFELMSVGEASQKINWAEAKKISL
ncbi:MAG: polysaccharide deacetylase family protein [Lentimicrobiaceae bacterium]|jgi:polysaccharide deacetylase family protein (PEP-CTERM system associated)|nr:polysaccharide deacetylase family protein [Lentimicrobiaceae bacterium]